MKTILALAAALALAPVAASAAPNDLRIDHSDLDLSKDRDVKTLEMRIAKAAAKHCGANRPVTGSRVVSNGSAQCAREFKAAAMEQFAALVEAERKGG